jgi:hypothetical protein
MVSVILRRCRRRRLQECSLPVISGRVGAGAGSKFVTTPPPAAAYDPLDGEPLLP